MIHCKRLSTQELISLHKKTYHLIGGKIGGLMVQYRRATTKKEKLEIINQLNKCNNSSFLQTTLKEIKEIKYRRIWTQTKSGKEVMKKTGIVNDTQIDELLLPFVRQYLGCANYTVFQEQQLIDGIEELCRCLPRELCCIISVYVMESYV